MILCDTGPLVAAAVANDRNHHACTELFTGAHLARRPLLVPATVVAEVGYMLNREGGARAEAIFLRSMADGDFSLVDLTRKDLGRMADLVVQYGDLPLGTTDASVIAIAERLNIAEVATLDHRHFTVIRPAHVEALTLVP